MTDISFGKHLEGRQVRFIKYSGTNAEIDLTSSFKVSWGQSGKKQGKKTSESIGFVIVEKESEPGDFQGAFKVYKNECEIELTDEACFICSKTIECDDETVYADIGQTMVAHKTCERAAVTWIGNRICGGRPKKFK